MMMFKPPYVILFSLFFLLRLSAVAETHDESIFQELTFSEKLRWEQAVEKKKKGESDIKSGNWYLSRKVSSSTENDSLKRAHAAGKDLVEKGELAIKEAEAVFETLRQAAISRRVTPPPPAPPEIVEIPSVKYSGTFEIEPSVDVIQNKFAEDVIASTYDLGYSQIIFDAIYAIDEDGVSKQEDWTQNIRAHLERLDGTRFSLRPKGQVSLEGEVLQYKGQPLRENQVLIYGVTASESQQSDSTKLISLHFVDPLSWQLRRIVNVVNAPTRAPNESMALLEDTNDFFKRLSAQTDDYSFRLSYSASTLKEMKRGYWLPAAFKEIALQNDLTEIVDTDTVLLIYAPSTPTRELFHSKGNASFTFNNQSGSESLSLFGKADKSTKEIQVGTLSSGRKM